MRRLVTAMLIGTLSACSQAHAGDSSAITAARAWVLTIRSGDATSMSSMTSVPFTYQEGWPRKQCQRKVTNQRGLSDWFACVRRTEKLLVQELEWERDNLHVALGPAAATPALRKLASAIRTRGTWVSVNLTGDGVTYSMMLLIDETARVSCALVDTDFDSG